MHWSLMGILKLTP